MYIEVLYADLSRQRKLIEEAHLLPKTNVLAVIISCPDEVKPRRFIDDVGYRRLSQKTGYDFYYLLKYWDDGSWWYGLEGRDTENLVSFRKDSAKPFADDSHRIEHPKYNCWSLVFEGKHVDNETWAEARKIFKEMH